MHQDRLSVTGQHNKQKESAGVAAVFLWLGIGLLTFATHEAAAFLSWQSALFFLGGTLVAALVFGLPAYAIHRGISKILARVVSVPTPAAAVLSRAIGVVVLIGQALAIYVVANWVVAHLLFASGQ
jgi:hypothetical protein